MFLKTDTKCLPILCYGIEVCPANKSDIRSLQYVVDSCFRKIFDIKLKETVEECMTEFNVSTLNDVIDARKRKFLTKYSVSENSLCQVFAVWVICDNCTRHVIHCTILINNLYSPNTW